MLVQRYPSYGSILPSIGVRDLLTWSNAVYTQQVDLSVVDNYRIIMAGNLKNAERENIILAKTDNAVVSPNQNLKTIITTELRTGIQASVWNSVGDRGAKNEQTNSLQFKIVAHYKCQRTSQMTCSLPILHYEPWKRICCCGFAVFRRLLI